MNEEKSRISTKEAAKEADVTPRTLQNYITSGKLSATRDGSGNYQIDKAEFYRVFPDAHKEKRQEKIKRNSHEVLEAENKHLKEMVSFLNKRLESSERKETALLETLNNNLKLLEYQEAKRKRKKILGLF
jgi:DNA-binding transcriptional MerR regulator